MAPDARILPAVTVSTYMLILPRGLHHHGAGMGEKAGMVPTPLEDSLDLV